MRQHTTMIGRPRRDPIKNFFPLPNVIYHLELSAGAIAVYGYLLHIEDRKTYQCYASYKTIGRAVRMSVNTVAKYVRELEERKLVRTEPTMVRREDGTPRNSTLRYTILPIQCAVDEYHQRQLQQAELDAQRRRNLERQEEVRPPSPRNGPVCPSWLYRGVRPRPALRGAQRGRLEERWRKGRIKGGGRLRPPPSHICPQCGQLRRFSQTSNLGSKCRSWYHFGGQHS